MYHKQFNSSILTAALI